MTNETFVTESQIRKEIVDLIKTIGARHSTWKFFEDFVALSAISISNAFDFQKEREETYLNISHTYNGEELNQIARILGLLTRLLNSYGTSPQDVLGVIFHDLELHNKYKGQFFTPHHICDFIGKISLFDNSSKDIINKKGYISILEPCCGSGAMILGAACAMTSNNFNYQKQMIVTAIDIDITCVYMTYIQLALCGIPAVVIHGNVLTVDEWSRWYTPMFFIDGWERKQDQCYGTVKKSCSLLTADSNGQLTLFNN